MKKIILLLFATFTLTSTFGQTDKHGNHIFNSETISEEKFKGFELTSSYYTIENNISDKKSSVYVSDTPTVKDYLKFSRDLPSYFFIVHDKSEVLIMIMLLQKNEGEKTNLTYNIVNPNNGKSVEIQCNVFGEISEKRVEELEKIKADTSARILPMPGGNLYLFDEIAYRIQPYDKVKTEIVAIATQFVNEIKKGK